MSSSSCGWEEMVSMETSSVATVGPESYDVVRETKIMESTVIQQGRYRIAPNFRGTIFS